MQRTESTIVQVAPDYENPMIKHMEGFGWNLAERQEIHEEGDTEGDFSLSSKLFSTYDEYVVKTRVSKYVKLHFARDRSLPNLAEIRTLEEEDNELEREIPSLPWLPSLFTIGGLLIWLFGYWFVIPYYFLGYRPKRAALEAKIAEVVQKRREVAAQAFRLLETERQS